MDNRLKALITAPKIDEMRLDVFVSDALGTVTIKPMSTEQHERYQEKARVYDDKGRVVNFDMAKYRLTMLEGQIVEPNFANAEFLAAVDCRLATDFLRTRFDWSAINTVAAAIENFSTRSAGTDPEELVEEAKN